MKRFKDLTELEIRGLSEVELAKLIDIECAVSGLAFIDEPKQPDYEPKLPYDIVVYSVSGSVYASFKNEEDAKKVADLLNECEYTNKTGMLYAYPCESYSRERGKQQEEFDLRNGEKKKAYDAAMNEYLEFKKRFSEIEKPILNERKRVIDKYERLDDIKHRYEDVYIQLADGNKEIAKNFTRDAYTLTDEEETYVFSL